MKKKLKFRVKKPDFGRGHVDTWTQPDTRGQAWTQNLNLLFYNSLIIFLLYGYVQRVHRVHPFFAFSVKKVFLIKKKGNPFLGWVCPFQIFYLFAS